MSSLRSLVCKSVMTLHHKGRCFEINLLILYFATLSLLLTQNLLLQSQWFVVILLVFLVAFGIRRGHFLDFGRFCFWILKRRVLAQSYVSVCVHQRCLRRLTFKAVFVLLKVVSETSRRRLHQNELSTHKLTLFLLARSRVVP